MLNPNSMGAIMNAFRNGMNPSAMMQSMAANNPAMQQFMRMVNGKTPDQLKQMAENVAKERGVSLNDVARQLGITLPSDK